MALNFILIFSSPCPRDSCCGSIVVAVSSSSHFLLFSLYKWEVAAIAVFGAGAGNISFLWQHADIFEVFPNQHTGFLSGFCSRALDYLLCFKKIYLQATSMVSFKWHLAVNEMFCLYHRQEFVHQSQRLLSDHELRERVVRNGKLYVEEHHGLKQERETYQRLVGTLLWAWADSFQPRS